MLTSLFDFLYAPKCVGCNAAGNVLCAWCLPDASMLRCAGAGRFRAEALGPYAGALRSAILAFKRGRRDVGAVLAELAAERLGRTCGDAVLVPVPTTARRRGSRGFDQGHFLATRIAERRGLGVLCALRQIAGDAQRGRSREDRLRASGRFALDGTGVLAGLPVLLVDDVMTTGATLRDCAATLERAGAKVRGAIVLARAQRPDARGVNGEMFEMFDDGESDAMRAVSCGSGGVHR